MAYAILETTTEKAPKISDGEDTYAKEMYLKWGKYFLYVHNYLHYSLLVARVEILKVESWFIPNWCISWFMSSQWSLVAEPFDLVPS